MAFVRSVKESLPGYGAPTVYVKREGVATNVGTVVTTLPSSGSFTPSPVAAGKIRVKTVSVVSTGTVQLGVMTVTDGTTVLNVNLQQTALAANLLLDIVIEFQTDLNNTSCAVTIIAGTANSVHDFEIAGNP